MVTKRKKSASTVGHSRRLRRQLRTWLGVERLETRRVMDVEAAVETAELFVEETAIESEPIAVVDVLPKYAGEPVVYGCGLNSFQIFPAEFNSDLESVGTEATSDEQIAWVEDTATISVVEDETKSEEGFDDGLIYDEVYVADLGVVSSDEVKSEDDSIEVIESVDDFVLPCWYAFRSFSTSDEVEEVFVSTGEQVDDASSDGGDVNVIFYSMIGGGDAADVDVAVALFDETGEITDSPTDVEILAYEKEVSGVDPESFVDPTDRLIELQDGEFQPEILYSMAGSGIPAVVWHNASEPMDATGDGVVAPEDVLIVINALNANGPQRLTSVTAGLFASSYQVDINGDGYLAPDDVLEVINFLNMRTATSAQATNAAASVLQIDYAENDLNIDDLVEDVELDSIASVAASTRLGLFAIVSEEDSSDDLAGSRLALSVNDQALEEFLGEFDASVV